MGQLAKALQRVNYLKNFVEGINALNKARKYDEIVSFLGQALSQDIKSNEQQENQTLPTINQNQAPTNTSLNSLVSNNQNNVPKTFQPTQTTNVPPVEQSNQQTIETQQQTTQGTAQPIQEGTNAQLMGRIPIENENETKLAEILKSYDQQKQAYLERVQKAQEEIKKLLKIGSIISVLPTMDDNEKKSILGLITSQIEGIEKDVKLREPQKPEVYDFGKKKIVVFGGQSIDVPDEGIKLIGQAKEITENEDEITYESFLTPEGKIYRVPIANSYEYKLKKQKEAQKESEKEDEEIQKKKELVQKYLNDAFEDVDNIKNFFAEPKLKLEDGNYYIKGLRKTAGGGVETVLENAIMQIGDIAQKVDIPVMNATKGIIKNFHNAFQNYVLAKDPEGNIINITNLPVTYKENNKQVTVNGLTNFSFKKSLFNELIKQVNNNKSVDIYNFYYDKVNKIVNNINKSYGNVLGSEDVNVLTNYYLVDLLANWNIYKGHITSK